MRCAAHQEIVTTSQVIIREGVPHEVILEEASSWGADLIVMGKLGRRGIAHILLGSVAERVIEFSEIPVLIVK
jgi:nucleotide-binding universal stress UspA family protein